MDETPKILTISAARQTEVARGRLSSNRVNKLLLTISGFGLLLLLGTSLPADKLEAQEADGFSIEGEVDFRLDFFSFPERVYSESCSLDQTTLTNIPIATQDLILATASGTNLPQARDQFNNVAANTAIVCTGFISKTLTENNLKFVISDPKINFTSSRVTDEGVKLAGELRLELNNDPQKGILDEFSGSISSTWGEVEFGYQDGAEDRLAVTGYVDGGSGNLDGETRDLEFRDAGETVYLPTVTGAPKYYFERQPNAYLSSYAPHSLDINGDSDDALKISYYTPRLYNTQLGVSYGAGYSEGGAESKLLHRVGTGINFSHTLASGFNMEFGAAYALQTQYAADDPVLLAGNKTKNNQPFQQGYQLGAKFAINRISFGLGFTHNINATDAVSGPGNCQIARSKNAEGCIDSFAVQTSIGYSGEKYNFGLGVLASFVPGAIHRDVIREKQLTQVANEAAFAAAFANAGAEIAVRIHEQLNPSASPQVLEGVRNQAVMDLTPQLTEENEPRPDYKEADAGVDMYLRLSFGSDYTLIPGIALYADVAYIIDRPAIKSINSIYRSLPNRDAVAMVFGSKISF